jgi:hypothetical protein
MRGKWTGAVIGLVAIAGSGAFIAAHAAADDHGAADDHVADRARGQRYAVEHHLDGLKPTERHSTRIDQCGRATRALYKDAPSFGSGTGRQPADAVAFWEGCTGGSGYYDD